MVGGARAQLCALTSRSSESPNPFRSLNEDDGEGLTYAGTGVLAHGEDVTTTEIRGIRAQRKIVRFKGADSLPQESRASRRADDSFEEWEKELRGNKNRSMARSAFPVATTEASRRSRPGVGRMAKLAPQRARKLESAQPQEPMDSIEVARGVAVKFELGASLTTVIAVCPVGGTVPTTPIVGKDLLTDIPLTIPGPVSSVSSPLRAHPRMCTKPRRESHKLSNYYVIKMPVFHTLRKRPNWTAKEMQCTAEIHSLDKSAWPKQLKKHELKTESPC